MKLWISAAFLFMLGCSHYSPVQTGVGEYTGKEIVSCSHNILVFPMDRMALRIDELLLREGLVKEDVYSIEKRDWPYLRPFYSNSCTILSLNASGVEKARISKGFVSRGVVTPPPKGDVPKGEGEFDEFTSLKECDSLMTLAKDRCRRDIFKRKKIRP